jgi:hypothetical protein
MSDMRQPYADIIQRRLQARGAFDDDFRYDPEYKEMNWLVRMASELSGALKQRGRDVSISDVIRAERQAAGHVDYHSKAALYMSELERGVHWLIQGAPQSSDSGE